MPKVSNTRQQRADELLARIKRGPSSLGKMTRLYQIWVESWILDDLVDLIPELKAEAKLREIENNKDDEILN